MKINDRFITAIELAYTRAQEIQLNIRFGIPGAMLPPDQISATEVAVLTDGGFVWDDNSQCWITDVKDMFDAA